MDTKCGVSRGLGKMRYDARTLRNLRPMPMPVAITAPKLLMHAVKAYVPLKKKRKHTKRCKVSIDQGGSESVWSK